MRDWKEIWIDAMGLVVALSGEERYAKLRALKVAMSVLSDKDKAELKECLRQRFTPSNGQDGRSDAMESMRTINGG